MDRQAHDSFGPVHERTLSMVLNACVSGFGSWVTRIALLSVLLVVAPPARAVDDTITVETLLQKMSDTRWLAVPPQPGERTVQFSSYDRATRLEGGKIVNPFANGDAGHYLRVEGEGDQREWVLAEAKGPGYVSRIWCANPDGELRIYIDGSPTPALAAPFPAITNGEIAPFDGTVRPRRLARAQPLLPVPVREVDQDHHDQGKAVFPGQRHDFRRGDKGRELFCRGPETSVRGDR